MMNNRSLSSFRLWKTIAVSVILWLYAGVLLFIWFFARITSEEAFIIRVGASFFSDLVWIPLGIGVWTAALVWLISFALRNTKKSISILKYSGAIVAAVIFVIFSPNTAFRFLFLPLILTAIQALKYLFKRQKLFIGFFKYLPLFITIAAIFVYYGWQLIPSVSGSNYEQGISVMTYNILGDAGTHSRMEAIETIRHEQPDVVCCTEYNPRSDPSVFTKKLCDLYPYVISNRDENSWRTGELILSQYPITYKYNSNSGSVNFIFAEIKIGGKKVNIVNVHLTRAGPDIEDVLESPQMFREKMENLSEFERINDRKKNNQAQSLYSYFAQTDEPTIICGDLNDTPNSKVYHLFDRRYINTFSSKGWGLGNTYGESLIRKELRNYPFSGFFARDIIRIDHIFVSKHFDVISSRVVRNAGGSDHKPVIALVRLKD